MEKGGRYLVENKKAKGTKEEVKLASVSGLEEVFSDKWFSKAFLYILLLMGSSLPTESGCFTDTLGKHLEP